MTHLTVFLSYGGLWKGPVHGHKEIWPSGFDHFKGKDLTYKAIGAPRNFNENKEKLYT